METTLKILKRTFGCFGLSVGLILLTTSLLAMAQLLLGTLNQLLLPLSLMGLNPLVTLVVVMFLVVFVSVMYATKNK